MAFRSLALSLANSCLIAGTSSLCLAMVNDPLSNWGAEPYGADLRNAWSLTSGNSDQVVAVLSTGIDLSHEDLRLWKDPTTNFASIKESIDGFNAFNETSRNPPADDFGLGTHEAGVIAAIGNNALGITGVAHSAEVMPVKVYQIAADNTIQTSQAHIIDGIDYVIRKKREGNNVVAIASSFNTLVDVGGALHAKIQEAGSEGILFVSASDDTATDIDSQPVYPASYTLPNLITVSSYFASGDFYSPSPFSSFGPQSIDVAAPGEVILSTWAGNGYQNWAGGSTSAAFVAGTAALVNDVAPNLSPAEVRQIILESVEVRPELDGLVGTSGILDAFAAVTQAVDVTTGDYNADGTIDSLDYEAWRVAYGTEGESLAEDGNGDGIVDAADYAIWRDAFAASGTAVPEPATNALVVLAASLSTGFRRDGAKRCS